MRRRRIQSHHRLVQNHQLRLAHERRNQRQLLAACRGNSCRWPSRDCPSARTASAYFAMRSARSLARNVVQVGDEVQSSCDAGHELVQVGVVRQKRQSRAWRPPARGARRGRRWRWFPLSKSSTPAQRAQRRGLARAVVADEADDLARLHGQRQIVHGLLPARVGLGKRLNSKHSIFPHFLLGSAELRTPWIRFLPDYCKPFLRAAQSLFARKRDFGTP